MSGDEACIMRPDLPAVYQKSAGTILWDRCSMRFVGGVFAPTKPARAPQETTGIRAPAITTPNRRGKLHAPDPGERRVMARVIESMIKTLGDVSKTIPDDDYGGF